MHPKIKPQETSILKKSERSHICVTALTDNDENCDDTASVSVLDYCVLLDSSLLLLEVLSPQPGRQEGRGSRRSPATPAGARRSPAPPAEARRSPKTSGA